MNGSVEGGHRLEFVHSRCPHALNSDIRLFKLDRRHLKSTSLIPLQVDCCLRFSIVRLNDIHQLQDHVAGGRAGWSFPCTPKCIYLNLSHVTQLVNARRHTCMCGDIVVLDRCFAAAAAAVSSRCKVNFFIDVSRSLNVSARDTSHGMSNAASPMCRLTDL
jgi:hypothetical protein